MLTFKLLAVIEFVVLHIVKAIKIVKHVKNFCLNDQDCLLP